MLSLVNLRMIAYNLHFQAFLFFFVIWWACRFSLFLSFLFAFISWRSSSRDSAIICFCVGLLFFLWWIHPAFSLAFLAGYAYFYYLCLTEEIARNSNGWQYLTDNPPVATSASGMLAHRACYTVSDILQRSSDLASIDSLQRWFDQWCPFGSRSDSDDSSLFDDAEPSLVSSSSSGNLRSDDIFPPVPDDVSSKLDSVCYSMEGLNISYLSHVSPPLSSVDRDDPSWLSNVNGGNAFTSSSCICQGSTDYGVCFCLGHVCSGTVCACGNGRGGGARGLSLSVSGGFSSGVPSLVGTSWGITNAGSSFWDMVVDVQKLASLSLGSSIDALVGGSPLLDPRVDDTADDASGEQSTNGGDSPSGSDAGDILSSLTTSLLTLTDHDSNVPVNDDGGNDATVDNNDDDDDSILAGIGLDKLRVGNTFSATPYLIVANNSDDSDDSSCASNDEDHVISGDHNHMFGGNSF